MPRKTSKVNHTCFKEHVTFLAVQISLQFMDMADSFGWISLYSQNMGDKCHLKTQHFIRYQSLPWRFLFAYRVSPSRKTSHQSDAICNGRAMLKARGSLGFHIIFLFLTLQGWGGRTGKMGLGGNERGMSAATTGEKVFNKWRIEGKEGFKMQEQ